MSDPFSFMFGFYGLLLGLALAEIAAGFSRAYDERKVRKLGIVAPLFGLLLLVDLITFWTNGWEYRDLADVKYPVALGVAAVSLLYYFAATQVFPKASDTDTLDTHIMQSRRVVVFCVLVSNLLTQAPPLWVAMASKHPIGETLIWASMNLIYYALLGVAALAPSKRVVAATLILTIAFVAGATAAFS